MTPGPAWSARRFAPVDRDGDTAPFFEAAARSRLALPRCANGHWLAPETRRCRDCGSTDRRWSDTAGRASLVAWTVIHDRPGPDGSTRAVATVAIAEVEEGPWLVGPLHVPDVVELRAGLPLLVGFDRGDDETIPYFTVAGPVPAEEPPRR